MLEMRSGYYCLLRSFRQCENEVVFFEKLLASGHAYVCYIVGILYYFHDCLLLCYDYAEEVTRRRL